MTNSLQICNPIFAATPSAPMQSIDFPKLPEDGDFKLAFMSNGKPNTTELYELVEAQIRARFPKVDIKRFFKHTGAMPAPPEVIAGIGEWADVAIFATAD